MVFYTFGATYAIYAIYASYAKKRGDLCKRRMNAERTVHNKETMQEKIKQKIKQKNQKKE